MSSEFDRNWDALVAHARRASAPPPPHVNVPLLAPAPLLQGWHGFAAACALIAANALVIPLWKTAWNQACSRLGDAVPSAPRTASAPSIKAPPVPAPPIDGAPDLASMLPDLSALVPAPAPQREEMLP